MPCSPPCTPRRASAWPRPRWTYIEQLLVLDVSEEKNQPLVLINPKILAQDGSQVYQEGCLSVPGIFADVERADRIVVQAQDRDGQPLRVEADGLLAVCIQHEMDHLIGKLFVDYLSPLKRELVRKKLDKQRTLGNRPPDRVPVPARLRLVFAGTPDFAVPQLAACRRRGRATIVAVYTQPDRPAGRGRKLARSPVKRAALDAGLRVEQPESLKDPDAQQRLARLRPDLMVVVAYGLILPRTVLACRGWVAGTCMPRCCRAGAVRRRSSVPCSPATPRPASA